MLILPGPLVRQDRERRNDHGKEGQRRECTPHEATPSPPLLLVGRLAGCEQLRHLGALAELIGARWAATSMSLLGTALMIAIYLTMPRARQIQ